MRAFRAQAFGEALTLVESAWSTYQEACGIGAGLAAANLAGVHAIYGRLEESESFHETAASLLADDPVLAGRLSRACVLTALIGSLMCGRAEPEEVVAHADQAIASRTRT